MDDGVIALSLGHLGQLFEALDPSPFRERDLDRNAEEFIVESAKELPPRLHYELVIHLDQPMVGADEQRAVEEAVRMYFARRANLLQRDLQRLMHRGRISLVIGVVFLATLMIIGQLVGRLWGESTLGALLRESLLIVGWVAMWRPIEVFLYDWWPIAGERRLFDRLSRIVVRILPQSMDTPRVQRRPGSNLTHTRVT
ncbi:MAG: hypothetical protein MUF06_09005 [Pirellulaceae bacterium]|nr:hypothetical protein [Pirellulaceae bacterium]